MGSSQRLWKTTSISTSSRFPLFFSNSLVKIFSYRTRFTILRDGPYRTISAVWAKIQLCNFDFTIFRWEVWPMWTLQLVQKKLVDSPTIVVLWQTRIDNHCLPSKTLHPGNSYLEVNGRLILLFLLNALRFSSIIFCCWEDDWLYLTGRRLLPYSDNLLHRTCRVVFSRVNGWIQVIWMAMKLFF